MSAAFILRAMRPDDAGPAAEIHRRSRAASMPFLAPQDPDMLLDYVRLRLSQHGFVRMLAERDGRILGYFAVWGDLIDAFYVCPDHWGQGVGSALMRQAKKLHPHGLRLRVLERNAIARRFFERHGFVPVPDTLQAVEDDYDMEYCWKPS